MKAASMKWAVGVVAGLAGIFLGLTPVLAGAPKSDGSAGGGLNEILGLLLDPNFGLEEIKNEVRSIETTVGLLDRNVADLGTAVGRVEAKVDAVGANVAALADQLELTADVNEAACASGNIQCSDDGSGHDIEAASAANHNPVQIVALVTRNGSPVTGLTQSNFFLNNTVLVAGGPVALLCPSGGTGCGGPAGALFQAHDNGTYVMFAHPGPAGINWRAGSAFATLQVVLPGGEEVHSLIRIDIPPAP